MKRILLIFLIFISATLFAQVRPVRVVTVANESTAFGKALPTGTIIIDQNTDNVYMLTSSALSTATLSGTIAKIDVAGDWLQVTDVGSAYSNVFLGKYSGANNTGHENNGLGYYTLQSNTSGNFNTAIGQKALQYNTSGNSNTATGYFASWSNTTGSYNVSFGASALYSNTTGSYNTAIGVGALNKLSSGTNNTALGYYSGLYYGYGSSTNHLTTVSNSIFIGSNCRPEANSTTNEIVIGTNAIGHGDSTVTLGDSSITDVYFGGANVNVHAERNYEALAFGDSYDRALSMRISNAGGTYYPNAGGAVVADLYMDSLLNDAQLILTPAGTKAGTGAGDGVLYSLRGDDFTVSRNCKKTYIDQNGYIRIAAVDEATIDYSNGVAVINNAAASSNQILYPFSYVNSYWSKTEVKVELDPATAGSDIFQPFSTIGGGWTDNGDGTYTCDGTTNTAIITPDLTHSTGVYLVEFTITSDNSGKLYISSSSLFGQTVQINDGSAGVKRIYLDDVGSIDYFRIITNSSSGWNGTIGNFSIKKVSGFASPFKDSSGNIINIAEKLVATAASPTIKLATGIDMTATTNSAKTYFIKPVNEKQYTLNGISVNFDTETYGTGIKVNELAGGWYELSLTEASSSADKVTLIGTSISSGDMCYLSGTQLEADDVTPFINDPSDTEGSAVTRVADDISITVPTGITKIIETFYDNSTNEITTIPTTYTLTNGKKYKNIIMYNN